MPRSTPASPFVEIASSASAAGQARQVWRRLLRRPFAVASGAALVGLALACVGAPFLERLLDLDGTAVNLLNRLAPPSPDHVLGTDELGRDLLVRLLQGGQVSLLVGVATALGAAVIGTTIGLMAGWFGGQTDALLMRLTDAVIALPLLPLLIVLAATDLSKLGIPSELANSEAATLWRLIAIVALVGWTTVARLVRAAALSAKRMDYVRAARALGQSELKVLLRHVLPNVAAPMVVATTLSIGEIILFESVLSFLGLGIQPPVASWGNMLTNAQDLLVTAPRVAIWPGLAIFTTVVAFNLFGDGLRDALDPRSAGRAR